MPSRRRRLTCALAALALPASAFGQDPAAADLRYGRDVRPLLAEKCFRCHGPDERTREADLRLDDEASAHAPHDDGAAIVPFDPAASAVWQRITTTDPDDRMPPAKSGKPPLSPAEAAVIERWIRAGAKYEPHWAFVPPVPPPIPAVDGGGDNPVDGFVLATLRARGLAPGPRADAATLARRVFIVLTGLPPTPGELDAFLADRDPHAYEHLVDRLLGEEPYRTRYAEHFATPWLDAARYADTSGIHMDAGRQIWPWRDWLLAALRDDMPFDHFVIDQLAGDLVPGATLEQRVASGFLRLHVTTDEGGAIDEEYRVEYAAERTATVGSVLLGLTVGCARCHDHKYDPIRQEDFYRLFAFFNSNREPGLYSQDTDPNRALEPFLAVPRPDQVEARQQLARRIDEARAALANPEPGEREAAAAFVADMQARLAATWLPADAVAASSANNATLTIQPDGSVLASGTNPPTDTHTIDLVAPAGTFRWLALSALADPSLPEGKVGRNSNGNALLQRLRLESRPRGSDAPFTEVPLVWAAADVEQDDGDHFAANAIDDDDRGWAPAAHQMEAGDRHLVFLAGAPFGGTGATDLRVTLTYDSMYAHHVLGRVRFAVGALADGVLPQLPVATSAVYTIGPFIGGNTDDLYAARHGPEAATTLDTRKAFGDARWQLVATRGDDVLREDLPSGSGVTYVGQVLHSPDERDVVVSLGSDDGFQLFVDGTLAAEHRIDRSLRRDQDRATIRLHAGANVLVLKIVNTGGAGGFALRHVHDDALARGELTGDLRLLLLPPEGRTLTTDERLFAAYRDTRSPAYHARRDELAALEREVAALDAAIPRTMVMHEADEPRPTFVLQRGDYDKPDRKRPVERALPAMFGKLPDDAPRNRLGLASWLVSAQNPLFARVAMNRLWQTVFGTGIVRTVEDFGQQGEWPSHLELLDWLACEFRARGLRTKPMLRLLVTSEAFCRSSVRLPDAAAADPDDRLLAWFPRHRLGAEVIRDQALYVAGLLVERTGGPSVKPRQPDGLWQEVAMLQSNTRTYVMSGGDDRWRRSLYVYWKRACPPPNLLVFDAPTREFCTVRRSTTNTPLQALALWNDPQFAEAARALAERTLRDAGDDAAHVEAMHRRCTGRPLDDERRALALATLKTLRERFAASPGDAAALQNTGDAPIDAALAATDVAPFTVLANAFLVLDATLCVD